MLFGLIVYFCTQFFLFCFFRLQILSALDASQKQTGLFHISRFIQKVKIIYNVAFDVHGSKYDVHYEVKSHSQLQSINTSCTQIGVCKFDNDEPDISVPLEFWSSKLLKIKGFIFLARYWYCIKRLMDRLHLFIFVTLWFVFCPLDGCNERVVY